MQLKIFILTCLLTIVVLRKVNSVKKNGNKSKDVNHEDECDIVEAAYKLCNKYGRDKTHGLIKAWYDNSKNSKNPVDNALKSSFPTISTVLKRNNWADIKQVLDARISPPGFDINTIDFTERGLETYKKNLEYWKDLDTAAKQTEAELENAKKNLLSAAKELFKFIEQEKGRQTVIPKNIEDQYNSIFKNGNTNTKVTDNDFEINGIFKSAEKIAMLKPFIELAKKTFDANPDFVAIFNKVKNYLTAVMFKLGKGYSTAGKQVVDQVKEFAITTIMTSTLLELIEAETVFRANNKVVDMSLCRGSKNDNWYDTNCLVRK